MQLVLERTPFLKALDRVGKLVEPKTTIPILSHLKLEAANGRIAITGTDLDCVATTSLPADVAIEGTISVSAKIIADIARKLPEGAQLSLALDEKTVRLTLKSGRAKFDLAALPAADFPEMKEGEMSHRFSLQAADLVALFGSVAFAQSNEETRYYLNGVYWHAPEPGMLAAVATDGHRLARYRLAAPAGSDEMPAIIVPKKAVAEILRLAKDFSGEVGVACSKEKISFSLGETVLTSKLIEGTFPDYNRVIPTRNDKRGLFDREPLLAAADRVAAIAGDRSRGIKCVFDRQSVCLSVSHPETGDAQDEAEGDFQSASGPVEIDFNGAYLREVLSMIDGPHCVTHLNDAGSPALFQARDDAPLLIILMPMRV